MSDKLIVIKADSTIKELEAIENKVKSLIDTVKFLESKGFKIEVIINRNV